MKRILILLVFSLFWLIPQPVEAIYDPLSVANNRIGVHILSPDEIEEASKLVNNQGAGSWGYVTVPIQSTDRDREKWLKFMNKARELKIIPIIRIATFADGAKWVQPDDGDLTDFANFLNDLPWPTINRYIIIFNEVNRADEYGGDLSPEHYTDILNNAIDIFKSRSDKFFILPSALDNAAPNGKNFIRWDTYLNRMYQHNKEIFNKIDGWNSHAYPNPGFQASSAASGTNKIDSFKSDLNYLKHFTQKPLPIFITETGWSNKKVFPDTIADLFNHAFTNVWNDSRVVTVTPFLLRAGTDPFAQFSLIDKNNSSSPAYLTIRSFATNGSPILEPEPTPTPPTPTSISEPIALPTGSQSSEIKINLLEKLLDFFTNLFSRHSEPEPAEGEESSLTVNNKKYLIDIVTTPQDQAIGLAKYDSLPQNKAMLFKFNNLKIRTFWMKDMKFDIDIIWIADDKVVGVSQGYYKDPLKLISSFVPVNYVLETNINSGIQVGDKIEF